MEISEFHPSSFGNGVEDGKLGEGQVGAEGLILLAAAHRPGQIHDERKKVAMGLGKREFHSCIIQLSEQACQELFLREGKNPCAGSGRGVNLAKEGQEKRRTE